MLISGACLVYLILPLTSCYETIFGFKKYIEYQPGTLNVVLSTPHGGYLKPTSIPDRVDGCWEDRQCTWTHQCNPRNTKKCRAVLESDDNTQQLTVKLADRLKKVTGKRPHVILNKLSRMKLDANREIYQATCGVADAKRAWIDYSSFILQAKASISGPGLYMDIHGQSHPEKWVEIGYHISPWRLDLNILNPRTSSLAALARRTKKTWFDALVRGKDSFGGMLQARGYKTIPSPDNPAPYGRNYFWAGGRNAEYNTKTYGSMNGGVIDGLQLESPRSVRNLDNNTDIYVAAVADTIQQFIKKYY